MHNMFSNYLKYLELRFNQHVRTIASIMFVIDEVRYKNQFSGTFY